MSRTLSARLERQRQRHVDEVERFKRQIQCYELNLRKAHCAIDDLKKRLAKALAEASDQDLMQSPSERIYLDIVKNHGREPEGRRYSMETLVWTEELHSISAAALRHVRAVLPLPGESLLNSRFAKQRRLLSNALMDIARLPELMDLWREGIPEGVTGQSVVLAVDAVAFRPLVTISEEGKVCGLKHLDTLGDQDLFTHLLRDPVAFSNFLSDHWRNAYTNLFVYHLQPINPKLPCGVIHAYAAENGKGTAKTVETLQVLRGRLEGEFGLRVVGLAFDGDSAFHGLHDAFMREWRSVLGTSPQSIPRFPGQCVIICDPLHLLKRIRYRLVHLKRFLSEEERIDFSLQRIMDGRYLSPIVFDDLKVSKMHDSLPLELFSAKTLVYILCAKDGADGDGLGELTPERGLRGEGIMLPWCLLVAALTMPGISTQTRIQLLEIGFWILYFYAYPPPPTPPSPHGEHPQPSWQDMAPRRAAAQQNSLFTNNQIRDSLNTFVALIIVMSNSSEPFCINRLGSNPLEHVFGFARIRCHDVETMFRLLSAFADRLLHCSTGRLLRLAAAPRRRCSVGVDCLAVAAGGRSIFNAPLQVIALSILIRTATPTMAGDPLGESQRVMPHWRELCLIPGFTFLKDVESLPEPNFRRGVRTLSSNQIFLGIMKTPRALHLISSPHQMRRVLDRELESTRQELDRIVGRRLDTRELGLELHSAAERLGIDPPPARRLDLYLQWARDHWPELHGVLVCGQVDDRLRQHGH
jgi:hypothetical protein